MRRSLPGASRVVQGRTRVEVGTSCALWVSVGTVQHSMARHSPSYSGFAPASARATVAARGSSKKSGTRCEIVLRRSLWRLGLRFRLASGHLPGRPDLVFKRARTVVFCDGDFWHGRNLAARLSALQSGHNAPYWVAKISANVARDRRQERELQDAGWTVLRYWETDILRDADKIAVDISRVIRARSRA